MHPKIIHLWEAPKYILVKSKFLELLFRKKQVLRDTLWKIWRIQIQIYPETSFELKYGAFSLKNKIRAHGLGLVVQLS